MVSMRTSHFSISKRSPQLPLGSLGTQLVLRPSALVALRPAATRVWLTMVRRARPVTRAVEPSALRRRISSMGISSQSWRFVPGVAHSSNRWTR
jgi:hypothetical protein